MTYHQAVIEIARFIQALEWGSAGYLGGVALWLLICLASKLRDRRLIRRRTHVVRTAVGKVRVRNR